jgi:hypothetical protein
MENFKEELIEYMDYYNNRRSKAKLKGLSPAIHSNKPLGCLIKNVCLTFWGHFIFFVAPFVFV